MNYRENPAAEAPARFETVLANGRIVDGSGNPWFRGDLAISAGRVAAIAPPGTLQGEKVIDVGGRFVTPGFVDIHTHSDLSILVNRRAESAVRQGATTHILGNCGMSPAPVDDARGAGVVVPAGNRAPPSVETVSVA